MLGARQMGVLGQTFRNRRRSPRASVLLPASVVTMDAYQYLELLNLSATGAKLRGTTIPAVGKQAMFRLDHFQVLCKILWAKDNVCGVRFDEVIPPRVLAHFKDAGTATVGMLTPDEQQAIDQWTKGEAIQAQGGVI